MSAESDLDLEEQKSGANLDVCVDRASVQVIIPSFPAVKKMKQLVGLDDSSEEFTTTAVLKG